MRHTDWPLTFMKLPAAHGTQAPSPFVLATVPGLHGACSVLPVGAKRPTPVSVHSPGPVRLVKPEYEPSLHGSAALAPMGQYEPGSQATHACSPSPFWYEPAAHLVHVPLPAPGWMVPGLHLVCIVLPVGAKWPTSVSVHSLVLVRLVETEYEPDAHGSAALAPSGQYEPGSQATHACSPSSAWYLPATHSPHKAAAEAAATKPAEQFLQSAGLELPGIGLAFPGAHAWHDALLFWPRSGLNVPAGHGVNVCRKLAAPSAEQEPPRGQSLHSVELTFSLNLPAGHVMQRVPPSSGL